MVSIVVHCYYYAQWQCPNIKSSYLTLNVNLYDVILCAVSIAGSTQVVTLIRLLHIPDGKLCVIVDDVVSANWHGTIHT